MYKSSIHSYITRFLLIYIIIPGNGKVFIMPDTFINKKTRTAFYFIAITALTAIAFTFVIKEGQRIKMENELLSYEVW